MLDTRRWLSLDDLHPPCGLFDKKGGYLIIEFLGGINIDGMSGIQIHDVQKRHLGLGKIPERLESLFSFSANQKRGNNIFVRLQSY